MLLFIRVYPSSLLSRKDGNGSGLMKAKVDSGLTVGFF